MPKVPNWKAHSNTRRPQSERMPSHRRRPECCRSPYRRGASNWGSAGRACRPALNDLYPSPAPLGWTRSTTPQRERRLKGGSAKKRRINLLGLIGYPCSHARVRVPAGYAATAGPRTLRDGHLSWFTPANAGHPQSAPIFRDTSSRSRSRNNKSKPVAPPNGNRLRTSWNRYFSWAVLDVGRMG